MIRVLVCPPDAELTLPTTVPLFTTATYCIWCGEPLSEHEEQVWASGAFDAVGFAP